MITRGLLLINLGTPNSTNLSDIKRYLREFLTDKRVIDISAWIRYPLVYGLIVPFRSKKSAHAYQSIWTEAGSPLMVNSQRLANDVQQKLGNTWRVALAMRYGKPSISQALASLKLCEEIVILPLYPQYASASTGSSLEAVMQVLSASVVMPSVRIIRDFYQHPAYVMAQAEMISKHLDSETHLLLSYHGVPERQIIKGGCQQVCVGACPSITEKNQACYRAQCFETSRLLAQTLRLNPEQYTTAFQSRLGKTPWIKPYTDDILPTFIQRGIENLAVACPSFTADCLETIEEIGIRLQAQWYALGGKKFTLIPCLNDSPIWVESLIQLITQPEVS